MDNETSTAPTVNQVVAWNMATLRKAAGMTQKELGERLGGWSNATVSAAEKSWDGKRVREFDADTLLAIATALGVPLLALFLPPAGGDGMAELFARVMPESADDTRAMATYRQRLAAAAAQYMTPPRGDLAAYLNDMANAGSREEREARQRVEVLRTVEREYRRRLRGYLEDQRADVEKRIAAITPAGEEDQ